MVYTLEEISRLVRPVAEKYHLKAVYIFGSYARSEAQDNSDIDVLVDLTGAGLSEFFAVGGLYNDLEDALQKRISFMTTGSLNQMCLRKSDRLLRNAIQAEMKEIYLLVGPAGVIHIETKDYIGSIDVQTTTYWRRDKGNNGQSVPFNSPAFQVNRHDAVIKHIVGPDVPVHAVICLANKNVELLHAERSEIPIVCLRDMETYLNDLDSGEANRLDDVTVKKVYQQIEDAKVRNSKKRAEYEKTRADKR